MKRTVFIFLGILTALVPAGIIFWSHTTWWPEKFARHTDTFFPNGPTNIFSDFVPSQRTDIISVVDGVRVRPITASPVYLVFQPRVSAKLIKVVLVARSLNVSKNALKTPADLAVDIGFRTGSTPETNVFPAAVNGRRRADGWLEFVAELSMADMFSEWGRAHRLVFGFPQSAGERWLVKSVRIFYEK